MFVNVMQFPDIPPESEEGFRQWFTWSNEQYAMHPGFIRRRLLRSKKLGNYAALIEHESYETFLRMHNSPDQAEAHKRLKSLLGDGPTAQFYELVEG